MLKLEVENIAKSFGTRKIFENINFSLESGQSIAIVGPNGSGKSTLLNLLLGLSYPTSGTVTYSNDGKKLDFEKYRKHLSLVAPYYSLYDSLTAIENLQFFSKLEGRLISDKKMEETLVMVGLEGRGGDFVSAYSTGMKQRLKYAVSILKEPGIWLMDEPTVNLDQSGKEIIFNLINEYKKKAIIIIATNEKEESALADGKCQLGG